MEDRGWNRLEVYPSEIMDVMEEDLEVRRLNLELLLPQTLTEKPAKKKKGETSLNLLILAILIYLVQGCKEIRGLKLI